MKMTKHQTGAMMDILEIKERLKEFIDPCYVWPDVPVGWRLELIAFAYDYIELDILHTTSGTFWSEHNWALEMPKARNGGVVTVGMLKRAGIEFLSEIASVKESSAPANPYLNLCDS